MTPIPYPLGPDFGSVQVICIDPERPDRGGNGISPQQKAQADVINDYVLEVTVNAYKLATGTTLSDSKINNKTFSVVYNHLLDADQEFNDMLEEYIQATRDLLESRGEKREAQDYTIPTGVPAGFSQKRKTSADNTCTVLNFLPKRPKTTVEDYEADDDYDAAGPSVVMARIRFLGAFWIQWKELALHLGPRRQRPIEGEEPCEIWDEFEWEEEMEDALCTKLAEAEAADK
ncbi:hypothetical protein QBC45DRAFT_463681 [Copromyces sp. CBS 386.78]|nr:hypothetical protein QBC45DRAFT_463681 [Copromyces sp. CBS 386.78]